MASGRLGALKPAAATYKTLYKPGATTVAVCNVSYANQGSNDDNIRIAVVQSASTDPTPATTEFVAYGTLVKASGDASLADRGATQNFILNGANNDQLVVYSVGGNVSFVVTGNEGTA